MNGMKKWIIFGVAFVLVINGAFYIAWADHDEYKKERSIREIRLVKLGYDPEFAKNSKEALEILDNEGKAIHTPFVIL